jgi:hypothetical protein
MKSTRVAAVLAIAAGALLLTNGCQSTSEGPERGASRAEIPALFD